MKILFYTFRTNQYADELRKISPHLFIFAGSLKSDFLVFQEEIKNIKPDWIIGVALRKQKHAVFEPIAINTFNKIGHVSKGGKESYHLYVPEKLSFPFKISTRVTTTFCNWTAYKVAEYIAQEDLNIKNSFIHLHQDFIPHLKELIEE